MTHVVPVKVYVLTYLALLLLLVATVGVYHLNLGPLNTASALSIALGKAALVILFFMHVKYSPRLTWVFAAGSFFWLSILLILTMADYLSRDWQ